MNDRKDGAGYNDPDAQNSEQADEDAQAQSVAEDAEHIGADPAEETERGGHPNPAQIIPDDVPDLVERMKDMDRSGRIDMGAYEGEENMDDEDGSVPE